MPLFIQYPSWITPEIFPGVPFIGLFRWYGLMYVFAFATAYCVFTKQAKEGALNTPSYTVQTDDIYSFFATGILGLLLGARIFYTLVYESTGFYLKKPWLIFWPFDEQFRFTGFAGMSYHGGFIGGFIGMVCWCVKHRQPVFRWVDTMAVSIPLGFTFGRIGNFLNAELYGRITTVPWGMVFPGADRYSVSLDWVQNIVLQTGLTVPAGATMVNLPRHPSQLYEALFEGVVLWLVLWAVRRKKPFQGSMACLYITGYGIARFIIEYFREPDADLGYRFASDTGAPLYFNVSLLNLSTGQVLCALMIAGGLALFAVLSIVNKKKKAKGENNGNRGRV